MARLSKAQLAGNVVVLPTAAARQVDNYRYADQRRASLAARKSGPFIERYQHPQARKADKLAVELTAITQTPELLILSAMIRVMDADTVKGIIEQLSPGVVAGRTEACQALATVRASRLNVGEQMDLFRAFDRLRGEG